MIPITPDQRRSLNARLQAHKRAVEALGLEVAAGNDPAGFAAERASFPGYVHPALDPAAGALMSPREFAWIRVSACGTTFAVIAARLYEGRLIDLLDDRAIWAHDAPSLDDIEPIEVTSLTAHRISGRISLQGGMIIDAAAQGLGLATRLMWMIRLMTLRTWQEDWQVGLLTEETHAKGIHIPKFGYDGAELLFDGPVARGPVHDREVLVYAEGARALAALSPPTVSPERRMSMADTR